MDKLSDSNEDDHLFFVHHLFTACHSERSEESLVVDKCLVKKAEFVE
jgi:hypothetical protein